MTTRNEKWEMTTSSPELEDKVTPEKKRAKHPTGGCCDAHASMDVNTCTLKAGQGLLREL